MIIKLVKSTDQRLLTSVQSQKSDIINGRTCVCVCVFFAALVSAVLLSVRSIHHCALVKGQHTVFQDQL